MAMERDLNERTRLDNLDKKNPKYTVTLKITTTLRKLEALRQYFELNFIEFEKIEEGSNEHRKDEKAAESSDQKM